MVVHTYYPSYTGSISRMIIVQVDPGKNTRPYLKNSQSIKGLGHGPNSRLPARGPELKPQYHEKEKQRL
jgi:hypothetical protein